MFLQRIRLVVFLLSLLPVATQQATAQQTIEVDASHVIGPHSTAPLMTVGAGRANEGLGADWQEQLATMQQDIDFKYLRFYGLLHDDMGVYMEDPSGTPIYNFEYVDALTMRCC